ncbi:MAG: DsbA family protein [Candidatus Nanopelagicales bacterium]
MVESKKSTKEKAAAARAAAEAEQRKRDRRIQIIGGSVIAVLVLGIIAIGVLGSRGGDNGSTGVVADAPVPTGVFTSGDYAWGVPVNDKADVPVLSIWEDFGCPACAAFEARMGSDIQKLATDGTIQLVYRPTTFIEKNFPSSPNPESSTRAANAYGCAIDAGKGDEYHNIVFANQPAVEGDGWTNQQLIDFGTQAGITGDAATTFEKCVNEVSYKQWTVNSYTVFRDSAVPGTPALFLDGKEIPNANYATIDALKKYIADNS